MIITKIVILKYYFLLKKKIIKIRMILDIGNPLLAFFDDLSVNGF